MPCVLRTKEPEEVDQFRVITTGVAPLAIHFSCKLIPHGVFCSLVAFLTRNCIKFQLPEDAPGSLTLIDAFSHFEVYINAPYEICVQLCPSIWYTLFEGIQKVAEILRYHKLLPKLAFLCKHRNVQPHFALPADAFNYWKCELRPDTVYGK